jgi:transposase InsO family protein
MLFWKRKKKNEDQEEVGTGKESGSKGKGPLAGLRRKGVPLEVKLLAVEALRAGLGATEVGELVGVTDSSVSKWRKLHDAGGVEALRRSPSGTGLRKRCQALEEKILAYRKEHPDAGVRRIRDELKQECIPVSAETVRQVVNEAGLGNAPPKSNAREHEPRRFERPMPNLLWQMDITTFQLKRLYPVYLVGIIDDHSRFIAGWGLFRQQTAEAVLEVLKGAIGQWGAPRELLSDNGRQFVAWQGKSRFQKVLTQQGIQHVRSAPHHPMTLGKIERFWKTIWTEFLEEAVFASFADASQRIGYWVDYYNHQRPHQGIDGATPAERFYGVAEDVEEMRRQGSKENALQMALGQAPKPPLYLLGRLGATDVKVVRQGDEVVVQVGDTVKERIRLGEPYRVEEEVTAAGTEGGDGTPEPAEEAPAVDAAESGPDGAAPGTSEPAAASALAPSLLATGASRGQAAAGSPAGWYRWEEEGE